MNYLEELKSNKEIFFNFMKEKYPVFYNSNIFERDLQYAIKQYFEKKDIGITYPEAEKLMNEFSSFLEEKGELLKLNANSWRVNFFKPETSEAEKQNLVETK